MESKSQVQLAYKKNFSTTLDKIIFLLLKLS